METERKAVTTSFEAGLETENSLNATSEALNGDQVVRPCKLGRNT